MTETANISRQISTLIKQILDERKIPYTIRPFDQTKAVERAKADTKGNWAKVKVEIEGGGQKDIGAYWYQTTGVFYITLYQNKKHPDGYPNLLEHADAIVQFINEMSFSQHSVAYNLGYDRASYRQQEQVPEEDTTVHVLITIPFHANTYITPT